MLGQTNYSLKNKLPKFVKVYTSSNDELSIKNFCDDVKTGIFPGDEFCYTNIKKITNNVSYLKFNKNSG